MISLVLAVLLGTLFTLVAVQNPAVISLHFFGMILYLPIYIIGAAAFLAGIFITSVFSLFDQTKYDFDKKEKEVSNLARTNESLSYQMQKVQMENARLQEELHQTKAQLRGEKWETTKSKVKGFFKPMHHSSV